MKLARMRTLAGARLVVEKDGVWMELPAKTSDLRALLEQEADMHALANEAATPLSVNDFDPPVSPGKIVAIGLNYLDHVRESGVSPPEQPIVFAKFPSTVIGFGVPIVLNPAVSSRVDWEGELAVVIGRRLRRASIIDALEAVFGYTIANDVSARDVQFADGQWIRGKNLDTFCPMGPAVVTADEIPDPQALELRTAVNGEVVQDAATAQMIFGVAEILSFCSQSFTLYPGDVILTGTPWGCGEFMTPRRSLADGDVVEVTISGVGTLRNPVVDPTI